MESDEKLRREIIQLSSMIAANKGGPSTSSVRPTHPSFNLRHYPPSPRPVSLPNHRPPPVKKALRVPGYPNPFNRFLSENYVNKVFPSSPPDTNKQTLARVQASSSNASYSSKYKLKNAKVNGQISNASIVPIKQEADKPKQVYLNPSYLSKVNSSGSLVGLSFAQCGVRPHINPAHASFQILKSSSANSQISSGSLSVPVSSSSLSSSTNHCDNLQQLVKSEVDPSNLGASNTVKSKYKLDRRVKRSPLRKKLFQRYSIRTLTPVPSWRWQQPKIVRKSLSTLFFPKKLAKSRRASISPGKKVGGGVRKGLGRKQVVHIDGNKFITKNGGKTLKRMKVNVVNLNGNRFVRKNGGRSLKRLSESLSSAKGKPFAILSSTPQTPGMRHANRAIQRSKFTLSQRIWKKKQFCVFYNRFGECKRKEKGTCPYIHDQKQLMICPKFIVGKCTNAECKLSHDLKVGRMPPCQFFNKSSCSRENCPYPHVKSSPLTKKSSDASKDASKSPSRKRKLSSKTSLSPVTSKDKKKSKKVPKDLQSRYYEQAPASQPIVSIIPRPFPKSAEKNVTPIVSDAEPDDDENDPAVTAVSNNLNGEVNGVGDDGERRSRLMTRISRLHERLKKKESSAPQFLPFN